MATNEEDLPEAQEWEIYYITCPHCGAVMESETGFAHSTIECEDCEEEFYAK